MDLLLSSAAASYGENLIAVVLTGSGSDGASGAVDVKNAGGLYYVPMYLHEQIRTRVQREK